MKKPSRILPYFIAGLALTVSAALVLMASTGAGPESELSAFQRTTYFLNAIILVVLSINFFRSRTASVARTKLEGGGRSPSPNSSPTRTASVDLTKLEARLDKFEKLALQTPTIYRSLPHLFDHPEALRSKSGGRIDLILDGADLPPRFSSYAKERHAEGTELRLLLLDPNSDLVASHRLTLEGEGDVEPVRAKMRRAIAEVAGYVTIRLYDALPPGNLVIVDDHIIWGGIPSVPTDAPLPLVELTVDTREQTYWAFRRNFDRLWDEAKPLESVTDSQSPSLVAGAR